MFMMHPVCAFSVKHLLLVAVLFPGVLLHFYFGDYMDYLVNECVSESSEFEANERRYNGGGESAYSGYPLTLKAYEIQNSQRPFECISNKIQGPILEVSQEYQNLKLQCDLVQGIVTCDSLYPYRTIDGKCNNLRNPKWGSVHSCAKRFMPPYFEGVSGFRRSVCGIPLPEPRILSLHIFKNVDKFSNDVNNVFTYFSQVISHDIAFTTKSTVGAEKIDCCSRRFLWHPQCAPIRIPPNDPYFSMFNVTCLNFVRTVPCGSCSLGKRNTMFQTTSFIDCSFLYGPDEKEAKELRRNDGTGKMLVKRTAVGDLMPPDFKEGSKCGALEKGEYCFKAGDGRANQQTPLTSFHTIFIREHNRIAEILKQLNPLWGEEKIYQETRKIVIAEMQVIVYKEFLPLLLGSEAMRFHELALSNSWTFYNPLVNPNIYAEFAFGAYRLHSLIPTVVTNLGADGGKTDLSEFVEHSAAPIYHGEMDTLLEGMCLSPAGLIDRYTSRDITETLFRHGNDPGTDLISLDIQRGRDTGLPPYTEVIRHLSKGKINIRTFKDLEKIFHPKAVQLLQSIYCDPRDMDYFVGMHFERSRKSGLLAHSAGEIVARQFKNLKFGDRFYFEHFGNFNKNQLRALRKVTLSTLICENTNLPLIQEHAMQFPGEKNPIKPCGATPKLNLKFWKA